MIEFRFAKSARKHRISKGRAKEAMANAVLVAIRTRLDGRHTGLFVGVDRRGLELEIGIAGTDDDRHVWLVVHVMPTHYRR